MSSPAEVIAMKVFGSVADMKAARASLGHPGSLAEAITATGIDALFVLLDGGTVEIEGRKVALYRPDECAEVECFPSGLTGQRVDFDGQYLQVWDTHGGTFRDDADLRPLPPGPRGRRELMRVHRVGETAWPAAVSDGLTLPCWQCKRVPHIDYRVNDDEWHRVVPVGSHLGVICLDCFVDLGGDPATVVELQVVGDGVTVVLVPAIAYEYPPVEGEN